MAPVVPLVVVLPASSRNNTESARGGVKSDTGEVHHMLPVSVNRAVAPVLMVIVPPLDIFYHCLFILLQYDDTKMTGAPQWKSEYFIF
jgi:hypothetical protein